jgi:hypothetical protein
VTVLQQDQGASFGAALQALSLLEGGGDTELPALVDLHLARNEPLCCAPDASAGDFYEDAYGGYQDAVSAMTRLYGS